MKKIKKKVKKVAAKKVKSAKKKPVVKKKAVLRKKSRPAGRGSSMKSRKPALKMTQERFDQLMAEITAI